VDEEFLTIKSEDKEEYDVFVKLNINMEKEMLAIVEKWIKEGRTIVDVQCAISCLWFEVLNEITHQETKRVLVELFIEQAQRFLEKSKTNLQS